MTTQFEISNYEFFTGNPELTRTDAYQAVAKVLSDLLKSGWAELAKGYCIGASDMLYTALRYAGINSRVVECQLMMFYNETTPPEIRYVGFDNVKNPGEIDIHVVVITDTNPPLLIDGSIAHRLPRRAPVVIAGLLPVIDNRNTICDVTYPENKIRLCYQQKINPKIPAMHQLSIIDRMVTDKRMLDEMKQLKRLNYIGIGLSIFALIAVINQAIRWLWIDTGV